MSIMLIVSLELRSDFSYSLIWIDLHIIRLMNAGVSTVLDPNIYGFNNS
jgi:hypothetical protein